MVSEAGLALFERVAGHPARTAIVDGEGAHTCERLLAASDRIAEWLLDRGDATSVAATASPTTDLGPARVAFLASPGFGSVAALLGIWRAGGVAVPLLPSHPAAELEYVLEDCGVGAALAPESLAVRLEPLAGKRGIRFGTFEKALAVEPEGKIGARRVPPFVTPDRNALILYTSGTTSRPKGVVSTHANLAAQIESLVAAWEWRESDRILHVLPLHHTHGLVNALLCPLWAGATCQMEPGFDASTIWHRFADGGITIFTAVPTIYVRLIAAWEAAAPEERRRLSAGCSALRVMISGSAALPPHVFERWRDITGQALLERYGMTEIGMALSNPLRGERRPGTVGLPLPGVSVKLVDEAGAEIRDEATPGELWVRGPTVFREYWNRPEATAEAFVNGWFRTGDEAVVERGYYRILGRKSVDILKTGGYKVSTLEIEETLRRHPAIAECAVVGVSDPEWGERVCAAVVPQGDRSITLDELRGWARNRLAPYKVPSRLLLVVELPRNAMGKVTKPAVRDLFEPDGEQDSTQG